ncbi:hypothetical protein [Bradyrhizobium erythrophlei]|uniref:Uncharacterized protein n=1 Tax=Bradyrhizobium erythrophlei TaxID=1437360 RepID=A0A1H5F4H0_9BRAD|nr:hypothetical protein [Bradyrhizobium erythrophlei]SED98271.1 hypothetical protein SAMN05444164_6505 [Bradyrhizobium erythrophlei]
MSLLSDARGPSFDEGLLLTIRNERPILIEDLSDLLKDLARDYRKISQGRQLVVLRLSSGSLIALLHDAAGILSDVNSLVTFGKTIAALTKIALGGSAEAAKLLASRKAGTQTVKSLAKIAVTYNGDVEMTYRRSAFGKEEFDLKLSPREAEQIQEVASAKKLAAARKPSLVGFESPTQLPADSAREISEAVLRLSVNGGSQASHDIQALIDAIVGVLGRHNSDYIAQVIGELEANGQFDIAQLLKDALDRAIQNRKTNPPLLT